MNTITSLLLPLKVFAFFAILKQTKSRNAKENEKYFIKVKDCGDSLPPEDILSSHWTDSQIECSLRCLQMSKCTGYNQRIKADKAYAKVSCQLSNKTQRTDNEDSTGGEWAFYQDIQRVINVNEIVEMNSSVPAYEISTYPECREYQWLTENNRNEIYSQGGQICDKDSLSDGWYRFGGGAGTKLASTCVPLYRCATNAPGWMNGHHPTVADGKVTRTVCYNWDGNCCHSSNSIEVLNCGSYYIYKLNFPDNCAIRHCGSYN